MEVKDLNIIPSGEMPVIHASQFDINRTIKFNLKEDGEDYTLQSGITITCTIKKVDGNLVTFEVINTEGKYIELTLPEQATACAGLNIGEVIFTDEDDYEIGTINFKLFVEKSPKLGGIESASSIHDLTEQIEEITVEVLSDNYYTKSEVDSLIEAIPTFDPTNYYNKTQTDTLLDGKADKTTTYTKTEVDSALALKADKANTYTKTEVDSALALKANLTDLPDMSNYYTKSQVDQKIIDIYPVNSASGSIANFATSLALPLVDGKFELPYRKWGYSQMRIKQGSSYPNWSEIQSLVQQGLASQNFSIGEEIHTTWERNGVTYDFPWVVMNFGTCLNSNDEEVPCMVLQAKYCDPVGMQFSGYPALLACPNGLVSGTYHFKCSNNWGTITGNTDYQFTLTQDIPNGGLLCSPQNWPDIAIANWKMTTYASNTATTAIETVALTAGSGGTDLGTFTTGYSSATMNGYQQSAYGYNRWSKSAIRQWLNSTANANAWWTPQTAWDRAPSKASTERGFLAGFPSDFLDVLATTKIKTALNTSDKTKEGVGFEYTYDKLFLPALEQMYINPQATGDDAEGAFWEYYKELNGTDTKFAQGGTYPELIKYDLTNHSTARYQRLRSAARGYSSHTWGVSTSGGVGNYDAITAFQYAPACIIH